MSRAGVCLVLCALLLSGAAAVRADVVQSEQQRFAVETVVEGLDHPWGMAFLPDGNLLITERSGALRMVRAGKLVEQPVAGLPAIEERGQGGLLGIALHPDFARNGLVYLSYTGAGDGGYSTEVLRGRLDGMQLADVQVIFRALPKTAESRHFGSRLVFDRSGLLYVSLGDRGEQDYAQKLSDHRGTLVRLRDDGTVPEDNPFAGRKDARPEIFTFGNRNMQGMMLHPETGEIWTHEHGPQGGDELNVMKAGANYGWPIITYGVNYGIGTRIGEGTHKEGMEQPLYRWVPSIAPSGMTLYTGDRFPQWRGDLFLGSLKFGLLVRLEMEGRRVVAEERMLDGRNGRIRDVVQGPDGLLYLLTDESDGRLLRLSPR